MSWVHTNALDAVAGGATQKTKAYDCARVFAGSFQATLASATGSPSLTLALQGSNAVPPNGVTPGNGWEPPEGSWVALGGASPITGTLSANGTAILNAPGTALLTRWVRATSTPAANTGGTLTVDVFLHDAGA